MRLLLDTNALLWMAAGSHELSRDAREVIERDIESVAVSAISLAEIAIKVVIKKLDVPADFIADIQTLGFIDLPFVALHAQRLREMPLIHRDPVDRMLVAQALAEDVPLVTRDTRLADYGVAVIRA